MPPQLQQSSSSPNMFPLLQANADPVSLQYPFPLLCVKRNTSTTTKGNQTFFKIEVKDPMQPNGPSLSMIIMEKPENAAARESLVEGSIINVSKIVRSSSKLYILTNFTVENSRSTSSTSSNHSSTSTTATTQRHISNPSATTTPATSNNNSRPGGAFGNNPSANSATPSSFQRPVNQQASNAQPQNNSRPPLNSSRPSGQQQVAGMNNVQQRPSSLIPQQQKAIPPSNSQTIDLKTKPIVPLVALTPWLSDWVIKARVTRKQDMKSWEKEGRKGNILSITLIDQDSTEIRATFFNEGAIKADSKLREQGVYYFKGGGLKEADRKYNSRIAHKYEISFKDNCIIQEAIDNEAMSIPQGRFSLTPLDQVKDSPSQDKFDIIGLVKTIGDPTEFKSKNENSNTTSKRDITILSKDAYGQIIEAVITLWGDNIKFEEKSIVIFTGVGRKLSDNGMSLSCNCSQVIVNVDIPEATELHQFFSQQNVPIEAISGQLITAVFTKSSTFRKVTIQDVANTTVEELDRIPQKEKEPAKTKMFFVRSHVLSSPNQGDFFYPACSNPDCKGKKMKKDADQMDPTLRCPSCGGTEMTYRYMASLILADYSSSLFVTAFDSAMTALLDKSAYDFATLDENSRRESISEMTFECATYRIRASVPQQGDKVRFTLMGMKRIENWEKEAGSSLRAIKSYMNAFGLK